MPGWNLGSAPPGRGNGVDEAGNFKLKNNFILLLVHLDRGL